MPTHQNPECFVITDAKGLTDNAITMASSQGVSQVGTSLQGQSVQAKQIIITGTIVGNATHNRQVMLNTIAPLAELELVFDNWIKVKAYPQETPVIERKKYNPNFQFTVYCPYPYWRTLDQVMTDVAGLEPLFHFPINYYNTYFENPKIHMFGRRIQQFFVNVRNEGNVPSPFDVIFIAKTALSNPRITLVEEPISTKYILIEKDMVAGEIITVEMSGDTIECNSRVGDVTTDIFAYLSIDSTYFELSVGDNLIRYDATINREGLEVRINRYHAYAGAFGDDNTYL